MTEREKSQDPVTTNGHSDLSTLYPGLGFYLNFLLDPAQKKSELFQRAVDEFTLSVLHGNLPPHFAHDLGITAGPIEVKSVLIGHPILLNLEKQMEMVRIFLGCWFGIVEKLSGDAPIRGVASIAYGRIDFIKTTHFGEIRGEAYDHGFKTFIETVSTLKTWKSTGSHRISLNRAAAERLKIPLSTEIYQGIECPSCVLYGYDWREDLIPWPDF